MAMRKSWIGACDLLGSSRPAGKKAKFKGHVINDQPPPLQQTHANSKKALDNIVFSTQLASSPGPLVPLEAAGARR
ncbi:MAG: hypothetical protein VW339_12140 [Quisquiliibacterium sp.]